MLPFAQVLLDGLFTGSTYALIAAGLALILGVVKVVNLSHGAFFSLGAYIAYVLSTKGVSNPMVAVLLACVIAFAFGVFLGKSFINPVRSHPFSVAVAVAGVLLAPATSITPTMGRVPLILSLIVVIASGMENVAAIFLLAVGLGLLSNVSAYLFSPQWSYVSLLSVICLLLLLRPEGLSATVPGRDY
jgi:branched-chain amino acid transport system permease protein